MKALHALNAPPIEGTPITWYVTHPTLTATEAYDRARAYYQDTVYANWTQGRIERIGPDPEVERLQQRLQMVERELYRLQREQTPVLVSWDEFKPTK